MADIELVIKISEEDYKIMKHNIAINNPLCPLSQEEMVSKVANGTPLPKGHGRKFEEIVVEYPPAELCTYPEYRGKPYFSIKYEENGEHIIGFGTYNPEVFSKYLQEYFITPTIIEADKEYEVEVITRGNCMMCGKELVEVDGLFFCKECENKVNGRK